MKFLEDTLKNLIDRMQMTRRFNLPEFINVMENAFRQTGFRDEHNDDEQKNILVTRLDAIGDNVLNSSFLRELRRNYPAAHITLIVNPTVYNLVELCPYVNEVIKIAGSRNLIEWLNEVIKICSEKLWHRHFDIYFNPRWDTDWYNASLLGFISGAKERIGYSEKVNPDKERFNAGYNVFLTKVIINPPDIIHETKRNLFVLKALGLTVQDDKNELWYSHEDILNANKLLDDAAKGRRLISVCNSTGPAGASRIYPSELFAQALHLIANKFDCTFVYLGGKEFSVLGEILQRSLDNKIINLCGKTTLREMCAAVWKTSMYIGVDTGTMHIAGALHLPVIEISRIAADVPINYISTHARFTPYQSTTIIVQPQHALSPCEGIECNANGPHCITQITPESIAAAFETMMKITYNK